nr:2-hydroxyacid dehydrogenase [Rhizobium sp. ACO-34A]
MIRIGLLGVLVSQVDRLKKFWDFPYEIIDLEAPLPPTGKHEVDVLLSVVFKAEHAQRVNFKLLQATGVGVDAIDFDLVPKDAWVCNMYHHEGPIAEYCILAMLNHEIRWAELTGMFSNETWSDVYFTRPRHGEVAGKTLGIVGFGHIGKEIATRAQAMGMRILAVASRDRAPSHGAAWVKGPEALGDLFEQSDYVVVCCDLNDKTRGLINAPVLSRMKSHGVVINVARGPVIDEVALYTALQNRSIGGAVLDVWYRNPGHRGDCTTPSDLRFDMLDNAVCTPHASAWTEQLAERRYSAVAGNIRSLMAGQPLINVVKAPAIR